MFKTKFQVAVGVAFALVATSAAAQLRPQYRFPDSGRDSSGPAAFQLGSSPIYATPSVTAGIGHDSNVTNSSAGERASTYQLYGADLVLDARSNRSAFVSALSVAHGRYNDSEQDNYTDYSARNAFDVAFDSRNFLHLGWDYIHGHEGRGSTDRGFTLYPDEYYFNSQNATYAFGAPGAQGRLEIYGSRGIKRYLNNRDSTAGSDRNVKEAGAVFYWRAMPKTYLLVEARSTNIHYLAPVLRLSGDETRYYVGAMWEATASTTGTVKVGQLEKKFDSNRPTFKDPAWEFQVDWSPRSYSNFTLVGLRTPTESTGLGNFILTDLVGLTWNHEWNSAFSTSASVRYQKDKYQGVDRNDDTVTLGLKANYRFRRWLTFGAEYIHSNRDSNFDAFGYDRNIWLLSANLSM